ncbi:macrophage colony-stimulating factor 1a isoform X2 [Lepisosteus oculatus]|uniref:macrophage colony-stimulating factor 1a isoform X2 n=1 Tax=Lepisosteus oculatus TaxID=7918 RepID=UPI0037132045
MTSYKPAHTLCKAKARHLCFLVLLCFQLAVGDVPGPCRHSVTGDHLKKVNSLIANQMQNGCAITYTFTEQGSLSDTCYVKAAFPKILELLRDHFSYGKSSDNYQYVQAVKRLVQEIYTQKCIQEIDLEREYDPAKFAKTYTGSPKEALEKVRKVISLYKSLMTKNNKPVNWNCEDQYAEDILETTTSVNTPTGHDSSTWDHIDKSLASDPTAQDSGKESQSGTSEDSNNSYKPAFIVVAVCGGLLLITTLYCFIQKKKLEALKHGSQHHEERVDNCSSRIAMEESELLDNSDSTL